MLRATLAVVAAAVPVAIACASPAQANQVAGPPFIDHTEWVHWPDLSSLRVYPSAAGRAASTDLVGPDEAWSEVLALSPDADIRGMRQQFVCHWQLAEFARPGKTSWNLEPWRPVVDDSAMIAAGCNPGGIEEPF